jgi:phosphomevalonate kinase
MRVLASAPGKLVITGEYAVLEGAPALVLAIDRQAHVVLEDSGGSDYEISAPGLGIHAARGRLDATGRIAWPALDAAASASLRLVGAILETLGAEERPPPFCASLDTRAFHADGDGRRKLGLGSSAALTVALASAIRALGRRGAPSLDTLLAAHRRAQHGHGSGLDVAASLSGGLLRYRLHDGQPRIAPAAWPPGLAWCCVWSGRPASTSFFLQRLAAWRAQAPARHAAAMRELGDCAAAAADAASATALLEAVAAYAQALERLAAASGLDIFCPEHRALAALAARLGVVYKTCGAGGGDIGIALAMDPARLQAFRQAASAAGFAVLELHPAGAASVQVH